MTPRTRIALMRLAQQQAGRLMPDDIAAEARSRRAPAAEDGEPGLHWRLIGRLESAAIGQRTADGGISVRRSDPAGCALYGPYLHLPAGFYRLSFECRSGAPRRAAQPVLGVEVIVLARFQRAWRDFTAGELASGTGSLVFEVPREHAIESGNEGRFEFRFFHLGNADLAITGVELARLAQPPPPAARQWRMLGRLEKARIGARDRDGVVTVRRGEPAGCLLYGGWPYLRLPRGAYRLVLRARSGEPRFSGQPVLGIEIFGRSRWRSGSRWSVLRPVPEPTGVPLSCRDVTAEEIASEAARLDFAVPAEMALEAGADAPVDIRLYHFANAALTIAAVDLIRLEDAEFGGAAAPTWRLLGRLRKGRIGAHTPDGISVGAGEPSSTLLGAGRPPLRLPEGRYRLSLGGRAEDAADRGGPVLRVRVAARPTRAGALLSSRGSLALGGGEVTAAELRAGAAGIEFAVPAALALGTGNHRVLLSLTRLGRGALRLTRIGLARQPEPAPPLGLTRLRPAGRRKVVMIGNCQMDTLRQGFSRVEFLNSRFEVKYHFVQLPKNLHEFAIRDLETCDILLAQDIRLWEEFPLRDFVRPGAEVRKFPLVRFASLWPFDTWNGPGDKEAYEREAPNLTFPYLDGLLGRLRREIPDREARFRTYRSLELPGLVNYRRLHQLEMRRLAMMDEQFEIAIGGFILENFRRRRVFHTTVRPNWQVFTRLMQLVADLLGVKETIALPRTADALLRNPQVPVHPRVARDLGIKWADENTRYLNRGREITWESYIRSYIEHYG